MPTVTYEAMPQTTDYYFEAHITIEPADLTLRAHLREIVRPLGFKVAKLLMEKGSPAELDSFLTARDTNYTSLLKKTLDAVEILNNQGYTVRRYKIENILLDVRP